MFIGSQYINAYPTNISNTKTKETRKVKEKI
jgi:hypothetical protein